MVLNGTPNLMSEVLLEVRFIKACITHIGRLPLSRNWSDIRNVTEDVEGEDLMQKIKDASFSLDGILKVRLFFD